MSAFKSLDEAIARLHKSVSEFPIGAVSVDDFKPIEEKIKYMRESLKHLNARLLMLKAQKEYDMGREIPQNNDEDILESLYLETASILVTDKAFKLCLHSNAIQSIFGGEEGDTEMRKKICASMRKLFTLNDSTLSIQQAIENALQKQTDLKVQCQNALLEYKNFLKEQDVVRRRTLEETNPVMASNKEKTTKTLEKINIMKKFIASLIAASGHMLMSNPSLVKLLERNRELIKMETIVEMCQDSSEAEL